MGAGIGGDTTRCRGSHRAVGADLQENDPVAAAGTRQASADRRADLQVDAAADSADRRARAAALRGQGWSNKRIARELGVHPSTVGRWFTSAHLPDTTKHVDAEEAKDA